MEFSDLALQVGGPLAVILAALAVSGRIVSSVWTRATEQSARSDELSESIATRAMSDLSDARMSFEVDSTKLQDRIRRLEEELSRQAKDIAAFAQERATWVIERAEWAAERTRWEAERTALVARIDHLESELHTYTSKRGDDSHD